jgi:hypothetical protein
MNAKNALGFLLVGALMKSLPSLEPHWFHHAGSVGPSAAATWMVCMGLIEAALGGCYLLKHHIWPALRHLVAYRSAPRGEMTLERVRAD